MHGGAMMLFRSWSLTGLLILSLGASLNPTVASAGLIFSPPTIQENILAGQFTSRHRLRMLYRSLKNSRPPLPPGDGGFNPPRLVQIFNPKEPLVVPANVPENIPGSKAQPPTGSPANGSPQNVSEPALIFMLSISLTTVLVVRRKQKALS